MHETSAQAWCTGKTQRDQVEGEVGGGIRMGNTCKSMTDSCQCMVFVIHCKCMGFHDGRPVLFTINFHYLLILKVTLAHLPSLQTKKEVLLI